MWEELGAALALLLVLEGVLPFLSPRTFRRAAETVRDMDDKSLRTAGLLSMLVGAGLLYLIR